MAEDSRFVVLRCRMVAQQLAARGIRDARVLEAMGALPRHLFVPPEYTDVAYADNALPIGAGQTISQPYIVALMAQAAQIEPGDKVLDVGTGSGYGAAVLSRLARRVCTIERHPELSREAQRRIGELGYSNVEFRVGNGARGWPEAAPFDVISVAAGGRSVPQALLDQLAIGGRLIIPVGATPYGQDLLRITRSSESEFQRASIAAVAFVPLVEAEGESRGVEESPETHWFGT